MRKIRRSVVMLMVPYPGVLQLSLGQKAILTATPDYVGPLSSPICLQLTSSPGVWTSRIPASHPTERNSEVRSRADQDQLVASLYTCESPVKIPLCCITPLFGFLPHMFTDFRMGGLGVVVRITGWCWSRRRVHPLWHSVERMLYSNFNSELAVRVLSAVCCSSRDNHHCKYNFPLLKQRHEVPPGLCDMPSTLDDAANGKPFVLPSTI
jgi:hypothetical protein